MSHEPLSDDSDFDEEAPIKDKMGRRFPFNEKRQMALNNPHAAQDRLDCYARLNVKVVQAKDLSGSADEGGMLSMFSSSKQYPDAYAKIELNDVEQPGECERKNDTVSPVWNYDVSDIDVHSPQSVLRVSVFDYDLGSEDEKLGWVEVPIADLPLGERVQGWFTLFPKTYLIGTAPERLEKLLGEDGVDEFKEATQTPCGKIFLELCLEIISGDNQDEWYANCLPPPKFKTFPKQGYKKPHEPLDMQDVYNKFEKVRYYLVDGLVNPFIGCLTYCFHWYECPFTCFFVLLLLGGCIFLKYLPAVFCAIPAFFLLCLCSRRRREAMAVKPSGATMNDAGLDAVAANNSVDAMTDYLERVVMVMNGKVLDRMLLHEFASFTFDSGHANISYSSLKHELRIAEAHEPPFLHFNKEPYADGSLVEDPDDGKVGIVKACTNPDADPGSRSYQVDFGPMDGSAPDVQEVVGDDVQAYMDMRWMSTTAVRAVIPDFLEDSIMGVAPALDSNGDLFESIYKRLHGIVSWENFGLACCITTTFFLLSAGCAVGATGILWFAKWVSIGVQVAFVLLIVSGCILVACLGAPCCVRRGTRSTANALTKAHAKKAYSHWVFFEESES